MDPSNQHKMLLAGYHASPFDSSSDHDGLKYDIPVLKRQENLLNNKFHSDVTFLVGEKRQPIYAHKLLLIMGSEYFYAMLNGNFMESKLEEIEVSDVEPEIFLEVLRFIYCDKVGLTIEYVLDIYVHAQKYMLNELRRRALCVLNKHMDSGNVLKIFDQNRQYEFSFINEKCLTLIRKNPLAYFHHEDFNALDRKSLAIIFSSKKINCSETQLFQALRDWKKVNRTEYVTDLQTAIGTKRSHNCSKLRFFGCLSMALPTDLKFFSYRVFTLFGIGVFIKSPDSAVTVDVVISQSWKILGQHRFEYENKDCTSVNVAHLFFEKLTLQSGVWCTIAISFIPSGECFTITNPQIFHDNFKLIFDKNGDTVRSVISHFYFEEVR